MKVLFLCRANIGRSQMAAAIYDKLTGEKSVGAGVNVKDREGMKVGDVKGAENMLPCLSEIGIDISGSEVKQVTPDMVAWADRIVVMTRDVPEYVKESGKVVVWDVPNPKGMDLVGHCGVRDLIKGKIEKLLGE